MTALAQQLALLGRPGQLTFQAPTGAPRDVLRDQKTSIYYVKSMILMKTALTQKMTFFLTLGCPSSSQGLLWSAKRLPAISQKASLGVPGRPQAFKKHHFTMCF